MSNLDRSGPVDSPRVTIRTASSARYALGWAVLAALGTTSCLSDADIEPAQFDCPSAQNFEAVSQVLERRCGTLDCHGSSSRPLRMAGRNGYRLSEFNRVGLDSTTPDEIEHNRQSVCGLEPERMSAVLAGDADPTVLTVVRKPTLMEAHKGGRVWLDSTAGFKCFASWLEGAVDTDVCAADLQLP